MRRGPLRTSARFQVRRRLGEGAVGLVYEALDRERRTTVAIKSLSSPSGDTILLLKNEFRAVQDVQHRNLVQLGELFEEGGEWFFTMEFVRGVDFLTYVRAGVATAATEALPESGVLATAHRALACDEARLRNAFVQLAQGLHALHCAGIVHRDVKPPNVLVEASGRVVVLDFGIASDLGRAPEDQGLTGTIEYMAPEQALEEPITSAADWYAVGVVLYQALTGELPFEGPHHRILERKVTSEPERPSARVAAVPPDLDALCADLLRLDPAERPTGPEVLKRLGAEVEQADVRAARDVFVGRARELEQLERAYADAQSHAVTISVEGEPGVGKSYLVRRFTDELSIRDRGAIVLFGRCYERESVPYKAIDGVMDSLGKLLAKHADEYRDALPIGMDLVARAFPVLASAVPRDAPSTFGEIASPQEQRARLFQTIRELLGRVAERGPLVIVIDDMQWADDDSAALLAEVLRPGGEPRLLFIGTRRPTTSVVTNRRPRAARPTIEGDVRTLTLDRLPDSDAKALARAALGPDASEEEIDAIVHESSGHPLFVAELVRDASARGHRSAPIRLQDALWRPVERLEPHARGLLELVTVAGLPITQDCAARAAALDHGQLFELAAVLRGRRLARTTGVSREDTIEPYHDRVRATVLAHLEAEAQKRWHGRLALALEGDPSPDPDLLAAQWHGAGNLARAVSYTITAAERADKALAFDRAAQLYRRALEWGTADTIDVRGVKLRLAEALTNGGRGAEAADVRLALASESPPIEALDLRRRAAEQLLCSGRFDHGVDVLRSALRAVHVAFPESPLAVIFYLLFYRLILRVRGIDFAPRPNDAEALVRIDTARSAGLGFSMSDNVRGAYFQTRALLFALDAGDPDRVLRALCMEICFTATGAEKARAAVERLLARAQPLSDRIGTGEALGAIAVARGWACFFRSEWEGSKQCLLRAEEMFRDRCVGMTFELNALRSILYRTLMYRGELQELQARSEPVYRELEALGDRHGILTLRTTSRMLLGLAADVPARVRSELDDARPWLPERFLLHNFFWSWAHVHHAMYLGDPRAAYEHMVEIWPRLKRSLLLRVTSIAVSAYGLRARAALWAAQESTERRAELVPLVERDVRRLERASPAWAHAEALLLRAGLAALEGDAERARSLYAEAEAIFAPMPMALHSAVAELRRGELSPGDEGAAIASGAAEKLRALGVVNVEAFARTLAVPVRR